MTQDRNQPGQGGTYPGDAYRSSTSIPGTTSPAPMREPWDPRREPTGAPMPWEKDRPVQAPFDADKGSAKSRGSKPKSTGGATTHR